MNTQNSMNILFHSDAHDQYAQDCGYADMEQMCYYEDREIEAAQAELVEGADMTERYMQELVDREEAIQAGQVHYIAPPPIELVTFLPEPPPVIIVHELDKVDSREVCGYEAMTDWQDLAGVY